MKAMQVYFKVPVEVREENGRFIASCFLLESTHEGPNKHEALEALTNAVQTFMTACCGERTMDAVLHRHDLRLPDDGDEIHTGRFVDASILLKLPAANRN